MALQDRASPAVVSQDPEIQGRAIPPVRINLANQDPVNRDRDSKVSHNLAQANPAPGNPVARAW